MNNIFHNLIHKVYLPAVKTCISQIFGKSLLSSIHIKSHNFSDKFTQWFCTDFIFVVLFCTNFFPTIHFNFSIYNIRYILLNLRL